MLKGWYEAEIRERDRKIELLEIQRDWARACKEANGSECVRLIADIDGVRERSREFGAFVSEAKSEWEGLQGVGEDGHRVEMEEGVEEEEEDGWVVVEEEKSMEPVDE